MLFAGWRRVCGEIPCCAAERFPLEPRAANGDLGYRTPNVYHSIVNLPLHHRLTALLAAVLFL
ncbi:MAG TPA: hypothetical protein VGX50_19545, partial [Longimicrobium sp.]|nr:hypothetical protein [Longimicrobium sp.]